MDDSASSTAWQAFLIRAARSCFRLQEDEAREAAQETMLRMLQSPPRSTEPAAVRAFALQVLRRAVLDRHRRKERASLRIPLDEPRGGGRTLAETFDDERSSPEDRAAAAERLRQVAQALARLALRPTSNAARDVEVFHRAIVRGERPKDVARDMGLAEERVHLIVHRIRRDLRAALQGGDA